MSRKKLLIIDGNSIVNRAFYGVPLLTDSQGRYTNGVYGFMNIFLLLCGILLYPGIVEEKHEK